jgi:hypothetical protein
MVVTILRSLAAAMLAALLLAAGPARAADDPGLAEHIETLVEQLDRGNPAERAAAERALVELGLDPATGEALLRLLPTPSDDMSQEAATRLTRIRGEVQTRQAEQAVAETRVTLDVADAPLNDVLAALEKQTGNHVVDYREQFGEDAPEKKVTIKIEDAPFWSALDQILDNVNMAPYPFAEEEALALVARQDGAGNRFGTATYAGPFRFETTQVDAHQNLRSAEQNSLEINLEIAWEPRLRPVALVQSAEDLQLEDDEGVAVPTKAQGDAFNVEVTAGSHSADVTLPMDLPSRAAKRLSSLKGRVTALIPGRVTDMRFDKLADARDAVQEIGGVRVTLSRVVQNQALWEIHMRVHVGSIDDSAAASRGWVFQNVTFLEDKNGQKLDHAGYETTMQNDEELGFAYFFELPPGAQIGDYTWVYRTPAGIVSLPVDYELKNVPLP